MNACVFDVNHDAMKAVVEAGASGAKSLKEMVGALKKPRVVWLMLPAALVDKTIAELVNHLAPEDVLIDGGNSHYRHDRIEPKRSSPTVFTMSTLVRAEELGTGTRLLHDDWWRAQDCAAA